MLTKEKEGEEKLVGKYESEKQGNDNNTKTG